MRLVHAILILALQLPVWAEDPLELSFVSEKRHIVPCETFSVGFLQRMQKGYHSYWKNPGTVGMGMSVQWKLPPGFTAGEIQWPTPEIGKMAVYDIWGYHDEAFLIVDIEAPPDLPPGSRVNLAGTVIWMCCGKSCFPGREEVSLTLPVAAKAETNPQWGKRFARTRSEQPVNSEAWSLEASFAKGKYQLTIAPVDGKTAPPKNIRFFDYDRQVSSDKGQRVKYRRKRATLTMHAEEHSGEELPRLRGILVADGDWQTGAKVIAVNVPITREK